MDVAHVKREGTGKEGRGKENRKVVICKNVHAMHEHAKKYEK